MRVAVEDCFFARFTFFTINQLNDTLDGLVGVSELNTRLWIASFRICRILEARYRPAESTDSKHSVNS